MCFLYLIYFCFFMNVTKNFNTPNIKFSTDDNLNLNLNYQKKNCHMQYKIKGEKCGDICVSSLAAPHTRRLGATLSGSCVELGYIKYLYSESRFIGPFGITTVNFYSMP